MSVIKLGPFGMLPAKVLESRRDGKLQDIDVIVFGYLAAKFIRKAKRALITDDEIGYLAKLTEELLSASLRRLKEAGHLVGTSGKYALPSVSSIRGPRSK